jgi:hypothetical protein
MRKTRVVIIEMNSGITKPFEYQFETLQSLIEQIDKTLMDDEIWGGGNCNFEVTVEDETQFTAQELDKIEDEGFLVKFV